MKRIKLMADYQCYPLWDMSPEDYRDIDPGELPISKNLQLRLLRWAATYEGTLDVDYPPNSGFKNEEMELEFKLEGARLAERLRRELGPGFIILFKE